MRVIAGKFRGKPLKSPSSTNIRPTGDKVKQAVFTKLQFFVEDKIVLDLFCGTGALGIEALSRNAKQVVFADSDLRSIKLTRENLKIVDCNATVLHGDYKSVLNRLKTQFDLILIDPPYASGVYEDCLEIIYNNKLLSSEGIIVCERDKEKTFETTYFEKFDSKVYGTVVIDYFKQK